MSADYAKSYKILQTLEKIHSLPSDGLFGDRIVAVLLKQQQWLDRMGEKIEQLDEELIRLHKEKSGL